MFQILTLSTISIAATQMHLLLVERCLKIFDISSLRFFSALTVVDLIVASGVNSSG